MKAYEVREATSLDGLVLNLSRPDPKPGNGQILVRMRAAALNYRDQGVIKGAYGYTKFPVIPLSDGAGEVAAIGPGVNQFKPGDRVASTFFQNWTGGQMPADASRNSLGGMIDGVLADYALLTDAGAIKIPDHLSFEESSDPSLRGAHRMERCDTNRADKSRRDNRYTRDWRRILLRTLLRQDAWGFCFSDIEQR